MKKSVIGSVVLFGAWSILGATAQADVGKTAAYAEGITATTVWKNSFGECWRTGTWTQEQAKIEGCDGYVKPAPVIITPAPAPVIPVPPPVAEAQAPVVAPAPVVTPAPVVAAPAVVPPTQLKFALKADVLFDSGKSDLKPKGKQALDALHADIQKANLKSKSIVVFGYADRLGNPDHNQKLSDDRASNVAKYLTAKGEADETIRAEGRGSSNPITGDTCNKVARAKLSTCLMPDRRVELEVTGTPK